MTNRIKTYDFAKGIGVISVVIGHMVTLVPNIIREWMQLFIMPLFFFISGYFAKEIESKDMFVVFIKKRIKGILLPYLIYSIILSFIDLSIVNFDKSLLLEKFKLILLGSGGYYMLWFLFSLFLVDIIFCIISFIVKDEKIRGLIVLSLVIVGYLLGKINIINIFKLGTSFYILGIFYLGFISKKYNLLSKINSYKYMISSFILTLVLTIILDKVNGDTLSLVENKSFDILVNYIGALAGIIFVVNISKKLENTFLSLPICYIGENSLYFYPLTGYIPDLAKVVVSNGNIIKVISRITAFIFTWLFLKIKSFMDEKIYKKHEIII